MKSKFFSAAILLLGVSCASAPTPPLSSAPLPPDAPAWTTHPTALEGSNLVFVVEGSENAEVAPLARAALSEYLDLPVGTKTPPVAAQAVEKFLSSVSTTKPSERFSRSGRSWWKLVLPKDSWDRSRTQLLTLFEIAAPDPSLSLEKSADDLLKQGRYFEAVAGYLEAAQTSLEAKTPQPTRFRGLLSKAQGVVSQFTLSSTTASQTTLVGVPFSKPFDIKLVYGSSPDSPVVAGVPLRFSYKTKVNGRLAVTGVSQTTDAQGRAQFSLPTPDFAIQESVIVLVDVNPWVESLVTAPKEFRDSVGSFETIASDRKLQLPYSVESEAKKFPMVVALADFDEKGSVLRRQETTTAVIAALQKAGFQTSTIPVNLTLLKSPNDNVILAAWKFQGKTTGRAVYGTVNLIAVTASGSQFSAEVTGTIKVVDLATSKLLYQLKSTKISTAADKATATAFGLRQWASEAVETLVPELP